MTRPLPSRLHAVPPSSPHERFCHMRAVMLRAYQEWLRTRPIASDVTAEIEATTSQLEQLHALSEMRRG